MIQSVKQFLLSLFNPWRPGHEIEFKSEDATEPDRAEAPPLRRAVNYKELVFATSQSDATRLANENYLVLIRTDTGTAKWLVMLCPCGCNEVRRISLSRSVRPHWRYHLDDRNRISLYPSVRFRGECSAHFVLRDNVAYLYWY